MVRKHVIELKCENLDLLKVVDNNKQYSRWLCLWVAGQKISDMSLENVKNMFEEADIEIPGTVI